MVMILNNTPTKVCEGCGRKLKQSEIALEHDGKYLCSECSTTKTFCGDCGDLVANENIHTAHVDGAQIYICGACTSYYWYCEECGEYFCTSDFDQDFGRCRTCMEHFDRDEFTYRDEQTVNGYGYKPKPKFISQDKEKTKRFYGMEIEIGDFRHQEGAKIVYNLINKCGRRAYLKRDGSIETGGYECVTHPMSSRSLHSWLDNELRNALETRGLDQLNTDGCGVHIHFSRDSIGKLTLFKLNVLLNMLRGKANKNFVKFFTQRSEDKLNRWSKICNDPPLWFVKRIKDGLGYDTDRYVAVNQTNSKTIEFRIFSGSIDIEILHSYLEFAECVLDFCVNTSIKNITVGDLFEFMLSNTGAYPRLANRLIGQVKDTTTGKITRTIRVPDDSIPDKFDQYFLWLHNYSGTLRTNAIFQLCSFYRLTRDEDYICTLYRNLVGLIKVERLKNFSQRVEHLLFNHIRRRHAKTIFNEACDTELGAKLYISSLGMNWDVYKAQLMTLKQELELERTRVNRLEKAERGRTVDREILYKKYYNNDLKASKELR